MGKLAHAHTSTPAKIEAGRSAVKAKSAVPDTVNHEGVPGFTRKAKGALFLLALSNMVGEDTFYETAGDRDLRFRELVEKVTVKDPDWVARFVPYLRGPMSMRTASIVMAAESAMVRLRMGGYEAPTPATVTVRQLVASALQRPDEPAEFVAYWLTRTGGKTLPGGVQRGVADAVARLFNEKAALKYDGTGQPWRMGDVINLVHPKSTAPWQGDLYQLLLDRRHHAGDVRMGLDRLPILAARKALDEIPQDQRRALLPELADRFKIAGMTWETASSWLGGKLDAAFWEAIIPSMSYMALLRNLRNFDETGVSDTVAANVALRLTDPEQVARSRQLPMRFLSAYKAVASTRWHWPLDQALTLSLQNVPAMSGRTLILVDMSYSMQATMSGKSALKRSEGAAVFGAALALRNPGSTLVVFGASSEEIPIPRGGSVLPLTKVLQRDLGGTATSAAVRRHLTPEHTRVVLLTDEQETGYGRAYEPAQVNAAVPADVWLHTFNLAGYAPGGTPAGQGRRSTFGGLSDAAFTAIDLVETGTDQQWPF